VIGTMKRVIVIMKMVIGMLERVIGTMKREIGTMKREIVPRNIVILVVWLKLCIILLLHFLGFDDAVVSYYMHHCNKAFTNDSDSPL
jgi:NhaP-type Na+/H+ or K+/H+ antiporter